MDIKADETKGENSRFYKHQQRIHSKKKDNYNSGRRGNNDNRRETSFKNKAITKKRHEQTKERKTRGKDGLDDSDKSSDLGGPSHGSDNGMKDEVDAVSGSAGVIKAES